MLTLARFATPYLVHPSNPYQRYITFHVFSNIITNLSFCNRLRFHQSIPVKESRSARKVCAGEYQSRSDGAMVDQKVTDEDRE